MAISHSTPTIQPVKLNPVTELIAIVNAQKQAQIDSQNSKETGKESVVIKNLEPVKAQE